MRNKQLETRLTMAISMFQTYQIHVTGIFTAKMCVCVCVCCPRPRGNIQREAKKRGRRVHLGS